MTGRPRKIDDGLLARVRELLAAGRSCRFIAKELGLSKSTVSRAVRADIKGEPVREREQQKNRAKKYGISTGAFNYLLTAQDGACAICRRASGLCIDHDHNTGTVRGLLCDLCNRAVGFFKDDVVRLASAIVYLSLAGTNISPEDPK